MPRPKSIPTYRLHKPSGRAVVTIDGRDVYLGVHGSPESRLEYDRLIAEWLAGGRRHPVASPTEVNVTQLADAYLHWAEGYYVKDGKPTAQQARIRHSIAVLIRLYHDLPAKQISPLKLKAVRQVMVDRGWTRGYVNACVGCLKRVFKWAVAEEMVPAEVYEALRAVEGLRRGRSDAAETKPIGPAPDQSIELAIRFARPPVAALIRFQLWTACRSGEAVLLRSRDLDRSGTVRLPGGGSVTLPGVWIYTPPSHKTKHHGFGRLILIGPRAQEAITPFLFRAPDEYCFSPREAWPAGLKRADRKAPTARYSPDTYRQSIGYALDMAEKEAGPIERFFPHQLRHSGATRLVSQFGWEIARLILGHRSVEVTRLYVADDLRQAAEAIASAG